MTPLERSETICLAAKATRKPCLLLSYHNPSPDWKQNEKVLRRDIKFLKELDEDQAFTIIQEIIEDGFVLIKCDSVRERDALFKQVDGDDTGGDVYAMTISPAGVPLNTNT